MKTTHIQPYLFFGGRCDEALEFYQRVVGAKVSLLMRYSDSPQPMPPDSIPAGFEKKVMHVTFSVGDSTLMASDGNDNQPGFQGFALSLSLPNETDANRIFFALADGGQIIMPIGKTFWSPCFGMLKDRFGLSWQVTVAT